MEMREGESNDDSRSQPVSWARVSDKGPLKFGQTTWGLSTEANRHGPILGTGQGIPAFKKSHQSLESGSPQSFLVTKVCVFF